MNVSCSFTPPYLGIGHCFFGVNGVQVAKDVLLVVHSGHVLGGVQIVVQRPHVHAEVDEEGDAGHVASRGGTVQCCVAVVVAFVGVAAVEPTKRTLIFLTQMTTSVFL